MKKIMVKWCKRPWLVVTYAIGIAIAMVCIFRWGFWKPEKRLLAILGILLPLHVFEENTYPDGFHYMMNLAQNSDRPDQGPMNRLTDMISNFGGELLFLALFLWGGNAATTILVAFFGVGETAVHLILGILTQKKLKDRGMKSIYGPGLATACLTMLPLSIYAIHVLSGEALGASDIVAGVVFIAGVIAMLIRIPMMVFGKFQPEYAFESSGYFRKFE